MIALAKAIGIGEKELIAVTGGGGKTTLISALSKSLPGGVVVTATTRISLEEAASYRSVINWSQSPAPANDDEGERTAAVHDREKLMEELNNCLEAQSFCLVVGEVEGNKVRGIPNDFPGQFLALPNCDFVLVEADGSRRLPCKAPASHEPVVPADATIVIPMVGIDCIGGVLKEVAHRPKLVSAITGIDLQQPVTPAALARLISHPNGGLKGIPLSARAIPFINKVDSPDQVEQARQIAAQLLKSDRIERVIIGSLQSSSPVREIHRRITAVLLAAGRAERMGELKQLLPWGDTTVLGHTIDNLMNSLVYEVVVISGYEAVRIEVEAAKHGASAFRNDDFEEGGMISSLQTALKNLQPNREAALVMLADQPMISRQTINRLLSAWFEGRGEIVAPRYRGRRGNPVIFGRRYFEELQSVSRGGNPREILNRRAAELFLVDVDDEAVLQDLDLIEEYERWRPKSRS
ncbi:MAG: selenium cofactor biosynthesis protein YqeC [Candidatus Promineifilaceae bacterium]